MHSWSWFLLHYPLREVYLYLSWMIKSYDTHFAWKIMRHGAQVQVYKRQGYLILNIKNWCLWDCWLFRLDDIMWKALTAHPESNLALSSNGNGNGYCNGRHCCIYQDHGHLASRCPQRKNNNNMSSKITVKTGNKSTCRPDDYIKAFKIYHFLILKLSHCTKNIVNGYGQQSGVNRWLNLTITENCSYSCLKFVLSLFLIHLQVSQLVHQSWRSMKHLYIMWT